MDGLGWIVVDLAILTKVIENPRIFLQLEIEGVRRYEFNLPKFVQDVGIVTKFLERLWTGNNAESVNEEAKARLITTVMQETFGKLLSPRIPRDIASLLPR